jgi:hypothetical protein
MKMDHLFPGKTHPAMNALRTGNASSNVIIGIHNPDGKYDGSRLTSPPYFARTKHFPTRQ